MSDAPENILRDIQELAKILERNAIKSSTEDHPILLARMRSVCPPALKVESAGKVWDTIYAPTSITLLITTRDDRRSTYLSIPIHSWVARNCLSGDSCKLAIRCAKKTLYKRHRGTWAERTLGRDTWAPMTEGGW